MKGLILISLRAHKQYGLSHIKSQKDQQYYSDMMDYLEAIVISYDNFIGPILVLEQTFSSLEEHALCLNREVKYKRLAIAHVGDIIISISQRFNGKLYA